MKREMREVEGRWGRGDGEGMWEEGRGMTQYRHCMFTRVALH